MPRHPLTLGARLEQDAGGWPVPEHGGEPLAAGDDSTLGHAAPVLDEAFNTYLEWETYYHQG